MFEWNNVVFADAFKAPIKLGGLRQGLGAVNDGILWYSGHVKLPWASHCAACK